MVVSELLATAPHHRVTELVINVNREPTGISYQLFMMPNVDFDNTIQRFDTMPLTRLDLALNVRKAENEGFRCFRNGLLKDALSRLPLLKHFHLHTNIYPPETHRREDAWWILLQELFHTPHTNSWPHLEYLGLANIYTSTDSLYQLVSQLPSLRILDMETLEFRDGNSVSGMRSLLFKLKENLTELEDGAWRDRRPSVIIRMISLDTKRTTIVDESNAFLYWRGECTMPVDVGMSTKGVGLLLDDFDPKFIISESDGFVE